MKNLIYDATLLVNAYETNLFRTGLYRVCSELLTQIQNKTSFQIYLYDVYGRERILRQHICKDYPETKVLGVESTIYCFLTYKVLKIADICRINQRNVKGVKRFFYKSIKHIILTYAKICAKLCAKQSIMLESFDAYMSTYYPIPDFVQKSEIFRLLIVHDLIPLSHPEYFPSKANEKLLYEVINSVRENDFVICVSNSTKKDFLKFRPDFNTENVIVAHLAGKSCFKPVSKDNPKAIALLQTLGIGDKPFILSVCTMEPRKNLVLLINAYIEILKQFKTSSPKLVLTGAYGWNSESLLDKLKNVETDYPGYVCLTGYMSDEQLSILYSLASVFVYPSLYEGFGLPPLEAMQCGTPVVVSDSSSLPEVVGDAGLKVSPTSISELKTAIIKMLGSDNGFYKEKSIKRASEFSWEKMSGVIIEILNDKMYGKNLVS